MAASAMIRARELEKRYGRRRVLRGSRSTVARGGFLVVTGPNGSGKTTLLRLVAGLAAPTRGTVEVDADAAALGYLGHEPLLYRDLTAAREPRALRPALPRARAARADRDAARAVRPLGGSRATASAAFSRGMVQRLALCRALLHEPDAARPRRAVHGASTREARRCSTRARRRSPATRALVVCDTRPGAPPAPSPPGGWRSRERVRRRRRRARAQGPAARAARPRHAAGDAALRRRDARRLPLRAARGQPATTPRTACSGWRSSSPRCSGSRARGCRSGRPARSTGWSSRRGTGARSGSARPSRRSPSSSRPRWSRCRRSRSSSPRSTAPALAGVALANVGICAVGSPARRDGGREPYAASCVLPLLFLPLAIPLVVGGVGAAISPEAGTYLLFLGLYDAVFAILSWASFEYVVTE